MQMKAVNTTFAYLRLCWHESDSWSVRLNSSSASPEAVSKKSLCHRTPAAFGVDIVAMHLDPSYARGIHGLNQLSRPSCRICISQIKAANWPLQTMKELTELSWQKHDSRIPAPRQLRNPQKAGHKDRERVREKHGYVGPLELYKHVLLGTAGQRYTLQ